MIKTILYQLAAAYICNGDLLKKYNLSDDEDQVCFVFMARDEKLLPELAKLWKPHNSRYHQVVAGKSSNRGAPKRWKYESDEEFVARCKEIQSFEMGEFESDTECFAIDRTIFFVYKGDAPSPKEFDFIKIVYNTEDKCVSIAYDFWHTPFGIGEQIRWFLETWDCVIAGSFMTAETMKFLNLVPGFEPSDMDIFVHTESSWFFKTIPFEIVRTIHAGSYDITLGIEEHTYYAKSIIECVHKGRKIQLIMLENVNGGDLEQAVRKYMDFTIVSQTLMHRGDKLWHTICHEEDLKNKYLRMNEPEYKSYPIDTKQTRIDRWLSRGFTMPKKINPKIIKSGVYPGVQNDINGKEFVTDGGSFYGCSNIKIHVLEQKPRSYLKIVNCRNVFVYATDSPKIRIDNSTVTIMTGSPEIESYASIVNSIPTKTVTNDADDDDQEAFYQPIDPKSFPLCKCNVSSNAELEIPRIGIVKEASRDETSEESECEAIEEDETDDDSSDEQAVDDSSDDSDDCWEPKVTVRQVDSSDDSWETCSSEDDDAELYDAASDASSKDDVPDAVPVGEKYDPSWDNQHTCCRFIKSSGSRCGGFVAGNRGICNKCIGVFKRGGVQIPK